MSAYGYSTVAKLEDFSSEDYGAIDAVYLADPKVDAKITAAEQIINTYTGVVQTAPIPDAYEVSTNMIADKLILRWLWRHNFPLTKAQQKVVLQPLIDDDVVMLLDKYKVKQVTPIKLHSLYNNDPNVRSF